mmetsp:Transcript_49091/g.123465  ORF Transcript_49091/g.123465 Transcript_49091/m.123465 type:complete len:133 (+) Transcript_49091:17-415(+)
MTDKKCGKCNETLDTGADNFGLVAFDKSWHKNCFACNKCGARLFSFSKFFEDSNKPGFPVCAGCQKTQNPMCSGCLKRIEDNTNVMAQGKHFHRRCFVCAHCNQNLSDDFFEDSGRLWHLMCFQAHLDGKKP